MTSRPPLPAEPFGEAKLLNAIKVLASVSYQCGYHGNGAIESEYGYEFEFTDVMNVELGVVKDKLKAYVDRHTAALLDRVSKEVIGEDVPTADYMPIDPERITGKQPAVLVRSKPNGITLEAQNKLRAEQRKRLSALTRGEGEESGDAPLS